MKRALLAVSLVLSLGSTGCLFVKEKKPDVEVQVVAATQYNHRGMVQNERGVVQPEMNIDLPMLWFQEDQTSTLSLNAWGNLNMSDSNGDAWQPDDQGGKFSEVDLTARYSVPIGPVDAAAGVLAYIVPNGSQFPNGVRGSTTEIFGQVGIQLFPDTLFSFYPLGTIHYDGDEIDGFYYELGVSKGFPLLPGDVSIPVLEDMSANVSVTAAYSDEKHSEWAYGDDEAGFSDLRATATIAYSYDELTTFFLAVSFSTILDSDLRDWFDIIDIEQDNVWGTFGISWKFF